MPKARRCGPVNLEDKRRKNHTFAPSCTEYLERATAQKPLCNNSNGTILSKIYFDVVFQQIKPPITETIT